MENVDHQHVEPDPSAMALRVRLGELLSRERLSQQKDVNDVARRLMLSKLQLLAIEAGALESFHHERRYIQGIKSYVFYLGLQSRADVNELVTQVEGQSAEALKVSPAARVAQLHRLAAPPVAAKAYGSRSPRYLYIGFGFLIIGAIVLAISEGWPFKDDDQAVVSTNIAQPVTTTVVTPLSSPKVLPASSISRTVEPKPPTATTQVEAGMGLQGTNEVKPSTSATATTSSPAQIVAPNQVETTQSVPEKSPAVSQSSAAAQNGKGLMRIDFNAECWVSLQTTDGKKEDRIYKSGEMLSVPLSNVTALVLGNAPAAKVFLEGRQVDVMSKGLTFGNVTRLDQKGIQVLLKN